MLKTYTRVMVLWFLLCFWSTSQAQTIHTFLPSQADSLITSNNTLDWAGIDTVPLLNKLFLFLPGTGAAPDGYLDILKTAGELGYHVLGLSYVNNYTIGSLCAGYGDTCQGQARMEDFYGENFSPVISVDSADGIRTRVIDALKYLNNNYPTEGWGQYLYGQDSILWSKVCVSGHSQGAGMASIIAYWFAVDRGVFFATGGDPSPATGNVAAWMDSTSATPPSRKYAFDHRQDELFWGTNDATPVIWDTLGLYSYGSYVSVDTLSGNFHGRHCFTSNLVISSSDTLVYHDCVATDGTTPITAGVPAYQPVWIYMMTDTGQADTTASGIAGMAPAQPGYEIYPNPATDMIAIDTKTPPVTEAISISDMTGRKLIEKVVPGTGHIVMATGMLAPGIYIATVNDVVRKICIR